MKGQKYFFDLNNFDQPEVPEIDPDLPPPPPVFSVEEMELARTESFSEGRLAGITAEKTSREHYIAAQVATLNTEVRALILAEQMREKRFEREVVSLCRNLVAKLFPQLAVREGVAEIEAVIERVLAAQDSAKIHIEVPMADVEDVYASLLAMKEATGKFEVVCASDLSAGSCRMAWHDGGALRNQEALTRAILQELDDVLALNPQKVQNNESDDILKGD